MQHLCMPLYTGNVHMYIHISHPSICPAQSRPAHSLGKSMLDVTDYCVHVAAVNVAAVVDVAAAVDVASVASVAAVASDASVPVSGGC